MIEIEDVNAIKRYDNTTMITAQLKIDGDTAVAIKCFSEAIEEHNNKH